MGSVEKGDRNGFLENAQKLGSLANFTSDNLLHIAEMTEDPNERNEITALAEAIRKQAVAVVRAAKEAFQNPSEENSEKMRQEYEKLTQLIQSARQFESTPPGFNEVHTVNAPTLSKDFQMELLNTEDDPDIVRAAKAQALASIEILNEATKIAQGDNEMLSQLEVLSLELFETNKRMVEFAKLTARYPDVAEYQRNFAQTQKELVGVVTKIAALTAPSVVDENISQLEDMVNEEPIIDEPIQNQQGINNIINLGDNLMKKMDQVLNLDFMNLSAEEIMANTTQITNDVKEVAMALKEMAKQTTNPQVKQALLNSSNIIQDHARKMKILSAVKAAQGSNDDNTLQSAIMVMKAQISSIMNDVTAMNLKHSVKNTEKQTKILKDIANKVRRAHREKRR